MRTPSDSRSATYFNDPVPRFVYWERWFGEPPAAIHKDFMRNLTCENSSRYLRSFYFMKRHIISLWCLAVVAAGAGCAPKETGRLPPAVRTSAKQPTGPTASFRPGDTLELYVDEDASFNGQYVVREGGYILIPKIGRIPVQGIDPAAAETRIQEVLQQKQLKHAKITVERNSAPKSNRETQAGAPQLTVYLTGSVPSPGVHNVPVLAGRRLGVYEVLLVTGGSGRFGNVSRVELLRVDASGRRQRTVIDLRPIRDGKVDDVPVADGDIIHVPEKVIGF